MTAFAATPFGLPRSMQRMHAHPLGGDPSTCAVRLVDRRTGALHRINGTPLTIFTRHPAEAAAELLAGRDPDVWEARVERLGPQVPGSQAPVMQALGQGRAVR